MQPFIKDVEQSSLELSRGAIFSVFDVEVDRKCDGFQGVAQVRLRHSRIVEKYCRTRTVLLQGRLTDIEVLKEASYDFFKVFIVCDVSLKSENSRLLAVSGDCRTDFSYGS